MRRRRRALGWDNRRHERRRPANPEPHAARRLASAPARRRRPARGAALGLKAQDFLDRNDAYRYFEALNDLVVTGTTYTNVNDFRALLVL